MKEKENKEKFQRYINHLYQERGLFEFNKGAFYLLLRFMPESIQARSLIDHLWTEIQLRKLNKNKTDTLFKEALGIICSELLIAQADNDEGWAYRSRKRDSFTDELIGESSFRNVIGFLESSEYIEQTDFQNRFDDSKARRIRLTPSFLALAEKHGVKGGDISHFRETDQPSKPPFPILLRASSTFKEGETPYQRGAKIKGEVMRVHRKHHLVKGYISDIKEINSFLSAHSLTYAGDPDETSCCGGFRRVFSCGDTPDHNYQKGGRLYPFDGGYQGFAGRKPDDPTRKERKNLLINKEATAEIDISGSHPRILMALLHQSIAEDVDPYGFDAIPRLVIKMWFTKTMGHTCFHTGWMDKDVEKYAEAFPRRNLRKDYPIKKVEEAVLARFPVLAKWPFCPIRWGDLQYIESCIIVKTMLRLARDHGIPAYPVHDSIIVPVSKAKVAEQVLREAFKEEVGVYPALSVKGA